MPAITRNEANLLLCLTRLDGDTLHIMRAVVDNPQTQDVAPRLRGWLSTELREQYERLERYMVTALGAWTEY